MSSAGKAEVSNRIRAGILHGPAAILATDAVSYTQILAQSRIPVITEDIISVDDYMEGADRLAAFAEDPNLFFFQVGYKMDLNDLGVFGSAVSASETLWHALCIARDNLKYFQEGSTLSLSLKGGRCKVAYHHPYGVLPEAKYDVQITIGLLLNIVSLVVTNVDPQIRACAPKLSSTLFSDRPDICSTVDSLEGFLSFDERLLRAPMKTADTALAQTLYCFIAGKNVHTDEIRSLRKLTRAIVRASFGVSPIAAGQLACLIGLPLRTMQARLKREGTSFREILRDARHQIALEDLLAGKRIDHIAAKLGFDHRQSFSEAFSQWEGRSPSEVISKSSAL